MFYYRVRHTLFNKYNVSTLALVHHYSLPMNILQLGRLKENVCCSQVRNAPVREIIHVDMGV